MIHYKEEDSTKNKPHYTITFLDDNENFIGMYSIYGYYLYNVFIDQKMRGKGYRKKNLYLDVDPDNIGAIKCYKRCGFKFVKNLENYHHPSWGDNTPPAELTCRYKHF